MGSPEGRMVVPDDPTTGRPAGVIDAETTAEGTTFRLSPELARWVIDTADLDTLTAPTTGGAAPSHLPGTSPTPRLSRGPLIEVDNSALYHRLRTVLAHGMAAFHTPANGLWPTADLTTRGQTVRAVAQLKPDPVAIEPLLTTGELAEWQQRMAQTVMRLDDVTADVLDVISAVWMRQATHPEAMATITADDFLRLRGLKPHKSGTGRRGGYKEASRRAIADHVTALANTWITVFEMEVTEEAAGTRGPRRRRTVWQGESRAVVVSSRFRQKGLGGRLEAFAWQARPGDVFARFLFGPGRQTALLSLRALEYDPYRQRWEKRLTRYLAWQWRTRRGDSARMSVATLLEAIGETPSRPNPITTKERLEKALDTLHQDGVIAGWQYDAGADEAGVGRKGWVSGWLAWNLTIEPPPAVSDQYSAIGRPDAPPPRALPAATTLAERLTHQRRARGLTQLQAAEEIGLDNTVLSRIERGKAPSAAALARIEAWLAAGEAMDATAAE